MRPIAGRLLAVAILIAGLQQVPAAEFRKSSLGPGRGDLLEVIGDLAVGDEKKFIQLALGTDDAIVVFHSPGGNLFAGIEIGKAIRLKGFSTYVPDGLLCASACSLAWLGGRSRLMSDTAKVGFHAAYTDRGGQNNVSAAGNAIVGAYLNQLGMPTSAIIYITNSAPGGMQWLNFSDAQRVGIEVREFNLASRTPAESPRQRDNTLNELVERETRALINAGNLADAAALDFIRGKYSEQVSYYGKTLTKAEVLVDKWTFFQRWPGRRYVVVPNSVAITCSDMSTCRVEGRLEWETTNRQSRSVGSASFSYTWTLDAGAWKVSGEGSKVLSRTVSSLTAAPVKRSDPQVSQRQLPLKGDRLQELSGTRGEAQMSGTRVSPRPAEGQPQLALKGDRDVDPRNVTLAPKTKMQANGGHDGTEIALILRKNESISTVLRDLGATPEDIRSIAALLGTRGRDGGMMEGQKLRILLSPTRDSLRMQPVRVIVANDEGVEAAIALSDIGRYMSVDVRSFK
jgi:hypothetical protein